MRTSSPRPGPSVLAVLAALVVTAGLGAEALLHREVSRARGALRGAVARIEPASDAADATRLAEITRRVGSRDYEAAFDLLRRHVDAAPSAAGHQALATAATATGRFEAAGRHAVLGARLLPRDGAARADGERALDLAMVGRVRAGLRPAAVASAALLLFLGFAARARSRRHRRRAAWVRDMDAHLAFTVDGQGQVDAEAARISRGTASLAVDVFLHPRGPARRAPRPGPTLSLVASHAASNTSLRLTPQHDVRDDAVRVRLKDATLRRLLDRPGAWRLQARLDDTPLAEGRIAAGRSAP